MLSFDPGEAGILDVVENECGAKIFLDIFHCNIVSLNPFDVTNEEAISGNLAEHRRVGINTLALDRLRCCLLFAAAASVVNLNSAQFHVLDIMAGNATDDATEA